MHRKEGLGRRGKTRALVHDSRLLINTLVLTITDYGDILNATNRHLCNNTHRNAPFQVDG